MTTTIPNFPTWQFAMVRFDGQQSDRTYLYSNPENLDIAVGDRVRVQVRPPDGSAQSHDRLVNAVVTQVSNSRVISDFRGQLRGIYQLLEPQVEIVAVSRLDGTGAGWYMTGDYQAPVGSIVVIEGGVMGSVVATRMMRVNGVGMASTILSILGVVQSPCPPSVDPDPTEHDVRSRRERRRAAAERRHLPTAGDHRNHIGEASGVPFQFVDAHLTVGSGSYPIEDVEIEVVEFPRRSSEHAPVRNRRPKPSAPVEKTKTKRKFKL